MLLKNLALKRTFNWQLRRGMLDVLKTNVDKQSNQYQVFCFWPQDNFMNVSNEVNVLSSHIYKILECGGPKTREKHLARGKLMVRDRIDRVVDLG